MFTASSKTEMLRNMISCERQCGRGVGARPQCPGEDPGPCGQLAKKIFTPGSDAFGN